MNSGKATHDLLEIQRSLRHGQYRITLNAARTAQDLDFAEADVVDFVLALRDSNFEKTMPGEKFPDRWQDVYRPEYGGKRLYVKLELNDIAWIISFHK